MVFTLGLSQQKCLLCNRTTMVWMINQDQVITHHLFGDGKKRWRQGGRAQPSQAPTAMLGIKAAATAGIGKLHVHDGDPQVSPRPSKPCPVGNNGKPAWLDQGNKAYFKGHIWHHELQMLRWILQTILILKDMHFLWNCSQTTHRSHLAQYKNQNSAC